VVEVNPKADTNCSGDAFSLISAWAKDSFFSSFFSSVLASLASSALVSLASPSFFSSFESPSFASFASPPSILSAPFSLASAFFASSEPFYSVFGCGAYQPHGPFLILCQ